MRIHALLLLCVLCLLPALAVAGAVEDAYSQARLDFFALRKDDERKQWRSHWMDVIGRLDQGAEKLRGERRCGALFNAGRAWHELSAISYLQDDRAEAIRRYRRLARSCPASSLADDALFHVAELQIGRDRAAARDTLDELLASHGDGDRAAEARELRQTLPAPKQRAAPGKRPAPEKTAPREKKAAAKRGQRAPTQAEASSAAAKAPASDKQAARKSQPPRQQLDRAAAEAASAATAAGNGSVAGGSLPSAVDILAALDARGADAARPEDVALAEDLRRDRLAREGAAGEPPSDQGQLDAERLAALEEATGGEIPLSLAAGLKVKRVVIDPGHGGKDTGAIGKRGTREKDLVLSISRKLKKHLEAMGLEVLLTRNDDTFLELEERTRFANENHADLFISVHVNAAENRKAYGIETYTLNLNSDRYAMRLAARENATSSRRVGDLQFILADLATKANTDDSVRLARSVQGEMVSRLRRTWGKAIRDLGVKQALFYVLVGARMPAILVEASFVSNPDEEKRLRTAKYQEETARSIAEGVRRFIAEREAIAQGRTSAGKDGSGVF